MEGRSRQVSDFSVNDQKIDVLKVAVLGDSGVGKSSIISQATSGAFNKNIASSSGATYLSRRMEVDGHSYELQIWDIAGQSMYRSIASIYFRDAHGIILVYDVTNRKSFDDISHWFNEIYTKCERSAVVLMLGNKDDMPTASKSVAIAEARELAESHKCQHMFVSACTGHNLNDAFEHLVRCIANSGVINEIKKRHTNSTTVSKNQSLAKKRKDSSCAC